MKLKTIIHQRNYGLFLLLTLIGYSLLIRNVFAQDANTPTTITITASGNAKPDSVQIKTWDNYVDGAYALAITKTASFEHSAAQKFIIPGFPENGLIAINTFHGEETTSYGYLPVSSGDQTEIRIDSGKLSFSGKGARKMQIAYELGLLHEKFKEQYNNNDEPVKDPRFAAGTFWAATYRLLRRPLDSLLAVKLKYLDGYKEELSAKDYNWLKANTICEDYYWRLYRFGNNRDYGLAADSNKKYLFSEMYEQKIKPLYPNGIPDSVLATSPFFSTFLLLKWRQATLLDKNFPRQQRDVTVYARTLSVALQERFVTGYLLIKGLDHLEDDIVDRAMPFVRSPYYRSYFESLRANTKTGDPAYNFILENSKGQVVRLSDFKGKVVFMDFWFSGCKWCKNYYEQTLKEVQTHFRGSKDVVFLSICIDGSKKTWLGSIKENAYTSEEDVNLYTQGSGSNHPLITHYGVKGYPTQIIVDRNMKNYNVNRGIQVKPAEELIAYLEHIIKEPTAAR